MGIFDKITEAAAEHTDAIKDGVEKVGDIIDEKTDNKFTDQVDAAQAFVSDQVDKLASDSE